MSLVSTAEGELRPRLSFSEVGAIALSLLIYAISLALGCLGVFILLLDWPNIILIVAGLLLIAALWVLRPRLGSIPKDAVRVEDFPSLYGLANRICDQMGTPHVSAIVVNEEFNAAFGQVGWWRKRVLWIGLPLWAILSPEERVAVLSHEMSHGANGDPARSLVVGGAIDTLTGWLQFLRPGYRAGSYGPEDLSGLGEIATHYLLWSISFLVELVLYALLVLVWRNSQIAEYLADYLATKASGTTAMIRSLRKLAHGETFELFLDTGVYGHSQGGREIIEKFSRFVASLPEQEVERLKRAGQFEGAKIDATHPPTAFRIAFLEVRDERAPSIGMSDEENARIDAELDHLKEPMGRRLIDLVQANQ